MKDRKLKGKEKLHKKIHPGGSEANSFKIDLKLKYTEITSKIIA